MKIKQCDDHHGHILWGGLFGMVAVYALVIDPMVSVSEMAKLFVVVPSIAVMWLAIYGLLIVRS